MYTRGNSTRSVIVTRFSAVMAGVFSCGFATLGPACSGPKYRATRVLVRALSMSPTMAMLALPGE
jgi:hypothetical protein